MIDKKLCFDTYVLVEMHKGNITFKSLLSDEFVIPYPILAEFFHVMYQEHNLRTAKYWVEQLKMFAQNISLQVWIRAAKYRYDHRKENLSLYDCLGYVFALENDLVFVTGDKQFKGKKGVMYVK